MTLENSKLRTIGEYAAAVALCLVILVFVMKLWNANPRTPFEYGGDALFYAMVTKSIIDNGWYMHNDLIGMPGGADLFYFPMADNLHFLLIKFFSIFSSDYALIFNFYFLLTFPLTTIASLYVFRHFKISYPVALLGSLLYTFLPYHFFRNQHHIILAGYYIVPLMVMVLLWVFSGKLAPSQGDDKRRGLRLDLQRKPLIASVIICLLVASGGLGYYAFFACFFLIVAGVAGAVYARNLRHLKIALILTAVVFGGFLLNVAPNMIYISSQGENQTVKRGTGEAEAYGLKITQLILPIDGHRIPTLARLKQKYNSSTPLVNENSNASLGLVGSVGFFGLLGWLLFWKPAAGQLQVEDEPRTLMTNLSILNISGLLLATIGGFASLFALLISPQMRSYNRISVYLAFFALFAVLLALEYVRRRATTGRLPIIFLASLGIILLLGIYDQTGRNIFFIPDYVGFQTENASDASFVKRIESTVPAGVMIFQLPFVRFPESPAVNQMNDYEEFRPYLHSKTLRWSYGAIKDKETSRWQMATSSLPPDQLVETLSVAGFSGIYIDRKGYADQAAELEGKLKELLKLEPLVSPNKQMSFFDLGLNNSQVATKYGGQLAGKRKSVLHPLMVEWIGGFSDLESAAEINWRWSGATAEFVINNTLDEERKIKLDMQLSTGYPEFANLTLDGDLLSEQLKINVNPIPYSKTISLPPGRHVIRFTCDAKRVDAPLDKRELVFKVLNFRMEEVQ